MTDLSALTAAALATDDDTPRLAYLDALEEAGGHEDYVAACREFYAKCMEKRKFGKRGLALPDWRDWLGTENRRCLLRDTTVDWKDLADVRDWSRRARWNQLLPKLWTSLLWTEQFSQWQRKGSRIEIIADGIRRVGRARLTFARGWLARVEFRSWQDADALLPAILADQPFAEAGIKGEPRIEMGTISLCAEYCGPAWEDILGEDYVNCRLSNRGRPTEKVWRFTGDPRYFAIRRALSDALRKRAGAIQANKPLINLSDHQTPPNRDKPDREQP